MKDETPWPYLIFAVFSLIVWGMSFVSGGLSYSNVQINFIDGTSCHAEKAHVFYENLFWSGDTRITVMAESISLPNKENYIVFKSDNEDRIVIPKEKILSIVSTKYCAKEDLTESQ